MVDILDSGTTFIEVKGFEGAGQRGRRSFENLVEAKYKMIDILLSQGNAYLFRVEF